MTRTSLLALVLASFFFACTSPPAPAPAAQASSSRGFDSARLQGVADVARTAVEQGDYAGVSVLVMKDGRTALERAYGFADIDKKTPFELDTIVRMYSMTKVVTCVAALQLVDDGVLRLDDTITRWLPELAKLQVCTGGTADAPVLEPLARPITVKHLINHTAGFTYEFFPGPVADLYVRADLWNAKGMDDFIARIAKLPLVRQPGVAFDYGMSNDVLAALVERASGMKFEAFVAQRITGPLHMTDTFFDVPASKMARVSALHVRKGDQLVTGPAILGAYAEPGRGYASGGAGLFSTIRDYARFAECLLEDGALGGARILKRETVERGLVNSLPPGVTAFDASMGWGLFSGVRLTPGTAEDPGNPGTFTWSGAATTHFFADPKEHLVALIVAQHSTFDERGIFPRFRAAVYRALE